MKLTDDLGKFLSNGFLIGIVVIGLLLTYMGVKARRVADNWEQENIKAVNAASAL